MRRNTIERKSNIVIIMLRRLLGHGIKLPLRLLRRFNAKSTSAQLVSHENIRLRAIGIALQETLNNILTTQEYQAISTIEKRRSFLLNSREEITVIDYGSGSPYSKRTTEEMEKGVKSRVSVSKITTASKPKFWATLLFKLVRQLRPMSCVELGCCVGISASYQAAALDINSYGAVVTLEGSDEIARLAEETFANIGAKNVSVVTGPFHKTLSDVLERTKPIDLFFNDGHHDHDAVIEYFNKVMPYLSDASIIIFDDISWSSGMRKAWAKIESDERVSASIDLHETGIALIDKSMKTKERFKIPL